MSVQLSRKAYAKKYGPTVGDRIRLADSELIIEIEHDYTDYGEESIFGGGKSVRDGQNQCPIDEPMSPEHCDLVITNAVIIDHWGIVKGDIGIRAGRIVAVGKSGNPLTQRGVDPRLVIGPGTEIIAGEGRICTAGGSRYPHSLHLSAADRDRHRLRHHHPDRRRNRLGHRNLGDDLHARRMEHHADAPGLRRAADQRRPARQRQRQHAQAAARPDRSRRAAASSCTKTGAPRPRSSTRASR